MRVEQSRRDDAHARAARRRRLALPMLALPAAVALVTALGAGPLPPVAGIRAVVDVFGEAGTSANDVN